MKSTVAVVVPVTEISCVVPVSQAKLDDLNSFTTTEDGLVPKNAYCTPTYFQEDYVEKAYHF